MLAKIYKNNNKFGGMGDNFNFKFIIFLNKCRQVGLLADNFVSSASIILLSQAQMYYYANHGNISTFYQFCSNM